MSKPLKTAPTGESVNAFLNTVSSEGRRKDCQEILELMKKITGSDPRMWGTAIVGFGDYHYKSESGREGDWFQVGFSPRKQNLTLYLIGGFKGQESLLKTLGKHKLGGGCLYINSLNDIDRQVLKKLIRGSMAVLKKRVMALKRAEKQKK